MRSALPAIESAGLHQDRSPSPRARNGLARNRNPATTGHASDVAGEAVTIRLSEEARASIDGSVGREAPGSQEFALAVLGGLAAFRQDAEKLFNLLGFDPAAARQAGQAATEAIRAEIGAPASGVGAEGFLKMRKKTRKQEERDSFSHRGSLVVQEATVAWDPDAGRCVAGAGRVALSVETESRGIIPRGSRQEIDASGKGITIIRFDAIIPLHGSGDPEGVGRAGG